MRRVFGALATLALVAGWWFVAPPELLGRTTLLTTSGTSMQPLVSAGDLAVVRKTNAYGVGDVIAYRSDTLNATVMHRIVAIDQNGITTKGDNNSWDDLDHPTNSQIRGELVHLRSGGGRYLDAIKATPVRIAIAVLIGLAAFLAFRSRKSTDDEDAPDKGARPLPRSAQIRRPWRSFDRSPLFRQRWIGSDGSFPAMVGALAVALFFGSITAASFLQPTRASEAGDAFYTLRGTFNYSASTSEGGALAYADGQVSTGDTIYLSLVDHLFVTYAYQYTGTREFEGITSFGMDAVVTGKTGWRHTIPLTETMRFDGNSKRANAVIDLRQITDLSKRVQELTGVRDPTYTLSIESTVHPHGTIGGQAFDGELKSELALSGDGKTFTPTKPKNNAAPESPTANDDVDKDAPGGISSSSGGTIALPAGSATQANLLGIGLNVLVVRIIAGTITALSITVLAALITAGRLRRPAEDPTGDGQEPKSLIVPVSGSVRAATHDHVVDLHSLNDLIRIAERHGMLILREEDRTGTTFVVNYENTTYRYLKVVGRTRVGVDAEAESKSDSERA